MNKTKIITALGPATAGSLSAILLNARGQEVRVNDSPEPLEFKAGHISYGSVSSR